MTETLAELLATCVDLHVTLVPTGDGHLAVDAPKAVVTPEFLNRIKAHKAGLLAALQSIPDPFADWRERADPTTGRVVLYDGSRHDGRLVWVDGPGESLASRHAGDAAAVGPADPPWPGWLADFVLLLAPDDLPEGLRLDAATLVVDRAKYFAALRADICRGARGPRAAVLGEELERLRSALYTSADRPMGRSI
ncbi:MAG: hypothetical protein U0836_11220 [Pirellulales bacterium]